MRIFLSVLAVALAAAGIWFLPSVLFDEEGTITVEVYNENDEQVVSNTHDFYGETTLFDVLDEHYDIDCETASFQSGSGKILLGIENVQTDFQNNFIYIEKNGAQSFYGVDQYVEDGAVYTLSVRRVE